MSFEDMLVIAERLRARRKPEVMASVVGFFAALGGEIQVEGYPTVSPEEGLRALSPDYALSNQIETATIAVNE